MSEPNKYQQYLAGLPWSTIGRIHRIGRGQLASLKTEKPDTIESKTLIDLAYVVEVDWERRRRLRTMEGLGFGGWLGRLLGTADVRPLLHGWTHDEQHWLLSSLFWTAFLSEETKVLLEPDGIKILWVVARMANAREKDFREKARELAIDPAPDGSMARRIARLLDHVACYVPAPTSAQRPGSPADSAPTPQHREPSATAPKPQPGLSPLEDTAIFEPLDDPRGEIELVNKELQTWPAGLRRRVIDLNSCTLPAITDLHQCSNGFFSRIRLRSCTLPSFTHVRAETIEISDACGLTTLLEVESHDLLKVNCDELARVEGVRARRVSLGSFGKNCEISNIKAQTVSIGTGQLSAPAVDLNGQPIVSADYGETTGAVLSDVTANTVTVHWPLAAWPQRIKAKTLIMRTPWPAPGDGPLDLAVESLTLDCSNTPVAPDLPPDAAGVQELVLHGYHAQALTIPAGPKRVSVVEAPCVERLALPPTLDTLTLRNLPRLAALPAGLTIGHLILDGLPQLTALPPDLEVTEQLSVSNMPVPNPLPESMMGKLLFVDGVPRIVDREPEPYTPPADRLVIADPTLIHLDPVPAETRFLELRDCTSLETLPDGLDLQGLRIVNAPNLRRLPDDLRVTWGPVVLRDCGLITTLPPGVNRIEGLDISGCPAFTRLPPELLINHWIDLAGAGVDRLPEALEDRLEIRWRDVQITHRIAFSPETITVAEILGHRNQEIRRVMIERIGYERFFEAAQAKMLDRDQDAGGERQLLQVDLPDQGEEPIVCVSVHCPSTSRRFILRVPPRVRSCHEAVAWTAGFDDPAAYRPQVET